MNVRLIYGLKFELNKKILYNYKSKLIHLESATGKEMNLTPMHVHSKNYFYNKWQSLLEQEILDWNENKNI